MVGMKYGGRVVVVVARCAGKMSRKERRHVVERNIAGIQQAGR